MDALSKLLAQGENLHTEFKQWPVPPDDLAAAMTAFANTDGGRIVLGLNDRGQVVGLGEHDRDRVAQVVDNVAFHTLLAARCVSTNLPVWYSVRKPAAVRMVCHDGVESRCL